MSIINQRCTRVILNLIFYNECALAELLVSER